MTIDTAIRHCLDIADGQDKCAEISVSKHAKERISQCAADHRQLAEWLTELKELEAKHWDECRQIAHYDDELKDLREENKVLIRECDRLIKEKGELLSKVSGSDVLRICQLEKELEKAKRLLKAAVEDMNSNNICYDINACNVCAVKNCISCDTFHWRYTDEVKRLLRGGDTNG